MAYTALYRKWRPKGFQDVIGQDHIVKTLTNQIKADRIGHAYLFCGTRGTGKTSTAKIYAKAVNCMQPIQGSPCNQCEICEGINSQKSMNLIEIDAASNNGVDNIRDIRDEVRYTPTEGKYKVYIIDEVHMLSIGAFNALLKTLEEPPKHVIFILATTEPHKIPITILSRCQRYDFKRIPLKIIAGRLTKYMEKESIEVDEKAISYISKVADGSMRDALSILDQCISFFLGEKLTLNKVLDILGTVDINVFIKLIEGIKKQSVEECLEIVDKLLVMEGRDLGQFVNDFTWFLRNVLIVKTVDNAEYILDIAEESILLLKKHSKEISIENVINYIRIFSDLGTQLKYASQKRVLLEVALIKLCEPSMDDHIDGIISRVESIEKKLEKGVIASPQQNISKQTQKKTTNKIIKKRPKALTEDMKKLLTKWTNIINEMPVHMKPYLKKTKVEIEGSTLTVICEDELTKYYLEMPERKKLLLANIEESLNKEIELQIKEEVIFEYNKDNNIYDELQKKVNFDITYIE
ncbi:MAG: DNA polymerase III subunit gamma/tau [Eubacteriales bacterium]